DDAVYAAARLLEVIVNAGTEPSNFFEDVPEGVSTPELRIDLPEEQHRTVMQELEAAAVFDDAEIIKVDGLRIEFADGWGLIRPSNTTPCLVLRFEAENREALERIQEAFRGLILSVNPDLKLPF
ncbi:MAG: phosphomannomutase/phosphoglucomutase, partial [Gammaproteobacteria bacterium]